MAIVKKKMNIPDGNGGFDRCHPETEVGQVVGLKEKFRQPSTAYVVGAIAYHASLPTGWYLECITAGTTSSGDLTISSPAISGTVSDGTVVWTISRTVGYFGGTINNPIISTGPNGMVKPNNTGVLSFDGGDPWVGDSAVLALHGGSEYSLPGAFVLAARNANNQVNLVGVPNGDLAWNGNDLGGSAIVAKSLVANGYIKYASGLILQWGAADTSASASLTDISFPVSVTSIMFATATCRNGNSYVAPLCITSVSSTGMTIQSMSGAGYINWFAIGY